MSTDNNVRSINSAPTAVEKRETHEDEALIVAAQGSAPKVAEYQTEGALRAERVSKRAKFGVKAGAFVLAVLAAAHFTNPNDAPKGPETGIYVVQPGNTVSNIADDVARNTPQHETYQESLDTIRNDNGLGVDQTAAVGDRLQITTKADIDKKEPGIQLNPGDPAVADQDLNQPGIQ